MAQNNLILLTGLWSNKDRRGNDYLGCTLFGGRARLLIFPNLDKETEAQPTHLLYITPTSERTDNHDTAENKSDQTSKDKEKLNG